MARNVPSAVKVPTWASRNTARCQGGPLQPLACHSKRRDRRPRSARARRRAGTARPDRACRCRRRSGICSACRRRHRLPASANHSPSRRMACGLSRQQSHVARGGRPQPKRDAFVGNDRTKSRHDLPAKASTQRACVFHLPPGASSAASLPLVVSRTRRQPARLAIPAAVISTGVSAPLSTSSNGCPLRLGPRARRTRNRPSGRSQSSLVISVAAGVSHCTS